jgi:hypothetical protein
MKWTLTRKQYREDGIFGQLVSEDGVYFFHTLEHAYRIEDEHYPKSVEFYPKIQEGLHPCIPYNSPKNGYIVPLLNGPDDQGRYFQIHIGNYAEDSEGCILVGLGIGRRANGGQMITSSRQAFKKLMEIGITEIDIVSINF